MLSDEEYHTINGELILKKEERQFIKGLYKQQFIKYGKEKYFTPACGLAQGQINAPATFVLTIDYAIYE